MRLIDADAAKSRIIEETAKNSLEMNVNTFVIALGFAYMFDREDDFPTIDAQPVKHGKWIECDYKKLEHGFIETFPNKGVCCSNCRTVFRKRDLWIKNYCPNCGARMDGGDEYVK